LDNFPSRQAPAGSRLSDPAVVVVQPWLPEADTEPVDIPLGAAADILAELDNLPAHLSTGPHSHPLVDMAGSQQSDNLG